LLSKDQLRDDLDRLRNAASDSNDIIRGILQTIHPETTPVLTNVLREYARKVAQRANFTVDFVIQGEPQAISQDVGQTVFYAFQELLSNVEKYAGASSVLVTVKWEDDQIELTVADNGQGFNAQEVNHTQHFGLEIMQERIKRVKGQMKLVTAENSGTSVVISLPSLSREISV